VHSAADGVDQLGAPTQPKNREARALKARAPHAGTPACTTRQSW